MHKNLRASCLAAALLGFAAISLSGEIEKAWLGVSWAIWFLAFVMDRLPSLQARLRRLETGAVILMVGLLILDFFILHNTIFVAVTHFLLLFQMVKLLGEKTRKDCFQIFLFSFLQVLAACTLSVDAWHGAILLLMIPTATAALFWNQMEKDHVDAHAPVDLKGERRYGRMALGVCVAALPLNVVLTIAVFVIFPRLTLNATLPGFGNAHAGFADQVNLAQKGSLNQNRSVVMWLSFPRSEERRDWNGYVRGEVLSQFDGRQWHAAPGISARPIAPDSNGIFLIRLKHSAALLHEVITLIDTSANTLFTSGTPSRVIAPLPSLLESENRTLRWSAPWRRPLHYDVTAELTSDMDLLPVHQELPSVPLERVRALAHKVAGRGSAEKQAGRIEDYLKKNYRYSMDFGDRVADNPVDYFLFDRRIGACGHFASAMAVMLRLQKIPSRLVAGYYKGEWNEPANAIVIREQDAHAWVEAFIPGKGWVAFDPTPTTPAESSSQKTMWRRVLQYADYASLEWNRLVIQYDLYSQIRAYESLRSTSGHFGQKLFSWWAPLQARWTHSRKRNTRTEKESTASTSFPIKRVAAFGLAVASLWLFIQKRFEEGESPIRFYNRFLQQMARAGLAKAPQETGWEFAQRLSQSDPSLAPLARITTEKYYQIRFSKDSQ